MFALAVCFDNINIAVCRHTRAEFSLNVDTFHPIESLKVMDAEGDIFVVGREGVPDQGERQYVQYLATSKENAEDIGEDKGTL